MAKVAINAAVAMVLWSLQFVLWFVIVYLELHALAVGGWQLKKEILLQRKDKRYSEKMGIFIT